MSNAQDLGAIALGNNFTYGGTANDYGATNINTFANNASVPYVGPYSASFNATVVSSSTNAVVPQSFIGYNAAYGATIAADMVRPTSYLNDNQPVAPWPKNQQIYYKLVGYNTNTQSFETWIIAEEIVPRPETFDPTGNFPNIDYNVYFTPPSGNKLVNIKIVGRWIQ